MLGRKTLPLLLLAGGTAARCHVAARRSISPDEAFSWKLTARFSALEIARLAAQDFHPPLYYLLLCAWIRVFGDGINALRSLSVIAGANAVVFAFLLAHDVVAFASRAAPDDAKSFRAGICAAALVAGSGSHIYASTDARMYAMASALTLASTWFLLRQIYSREIPSSRHLLRWCIYAALSAGLLLTHYYAFFVIAGHTAWLIVMAVRGSGAGITIMRTAPATPLRSASVSVHGLCAIGAATALCAVLWMPRFLAQLGRFRADYWIVHTTPRDMAQCWADVLLPHNSLVWGGDSIAGLLACATLAVVFALFGGAQKPGQLLGCTLLLSILAPTMLTACGVPVLHETTARYWVPALGVFLVGVAVLLGRSLNRLEFWFCCAILVANNAYSAFGYVREMHFDVMRGAEGAVRKLLQARTAGEPIIVRHPVRLSQVAYYLRDNPEATSCLRLHSRATLTNYNGGPVVAATDLWNATDLRRWRDRRAWVIDGARLTEILMEASLAPLGRPAGRSHIFPEPVRRHGKLVVTPNRFSGS